MWTGCLVSWEDWSNGVRGEWELLGWGGGLGGASITKMQCVGLPATGSANFAVKTDRTSPCVRAHRVNYSIQAMLWKMICNEATCKGCSTWDSILCQSDNENNSSRFQHCEVNTATREANIFLHELFAFQFSEGATVVVLAGHGAVQRTDFFFFFFLPRHFLILLKTMIHLQGLKKKKKSNCLSSTLFIYFSFLSTDDNIQL